MSFLREPNAEPIPGYRLIEPLGSGGFGEAWKCEAPGGLFKAIKFVFGNLNSLDVDGARAEQEWHALNRIKEVRHPFVLSLDRIEVVAGELVIVMELADKSLHDAYQECLGAGLVGIPRDTLLRYVRDAAEALDHMNEKHNLQHLDIKPRNLFLVSDRVKVADFGLVKHLERSGASVLAGVTPLYAPPETFSGTISGRSDQYSLAIVYQELLTGQRPFNGKNARTLAQQHLNEEPELRALPEAERPVVARALAKDPARRFPNCLAFVRALYTARTPTRAEVVVEEGGNRPKTLHDTMENMLLEQLPDEDGLVPVELSPGAVPIHWDEDSPPPGGADAVSQLGMTIPQPQTGALRPTLIVGAGSFGRRALLELRCRLLDRFGDLDQLPLLRFLYIDTDPEAIKGACRGAPEIALRSGEIYHLGLQPVSHYRRRHLDQLTDWLPREKLFALPRSLKTQGSRALGRLAFTDNYLRLAARLRREVQHACHPDSIYQTVSATGLALRDNTPRIYLIGCASGGASGYLADLGYALRRLLQQLHHPEAPITCFLFCGAPDDPATPQPEQANLYATLTELNHFGDPAIPFTAQYGPDGPRLVEDGPPFHHTYLLTQRHRTPECRRDVMAHLGSYLFHELTTPLGLRLDRLRSGRVGSGSDRRGPAEPPGCAFRSLGTYGVWFPRGLLLRLAARGACGRLLEEWQAVGEPTARAELEAVRARVLADPELLPEALAARISELAAGHLEGPPREVLTSLLATVEEQSQQSVAHDEPGAWARQALARVQEWLGGGLPPPGVSTMQQRKSKLTRALEAAASQLAEEWDERLNELVAGLLEHPGHRLAAGEAALSQFGKFCDEATAAQAGRMQQQAQRSQQAQEQLQAALAACVEGAGAFSWFGGRSRRSLRVFVDHLAAFARQCLAEDVQAAVHQFYAFLRGRLADRMRDLTFCRQRLRHMQENLERVFPAGGPEDTSALAGSTLPGPPQEWASAPSRGASVDMGTSAGPTPIVSAEAFWEALRASKTMRVVLPAGASDLEKAAAQFLTTLTAEQWTQLDQALQDQVLAPRSGLQRACLGTVDLNRHLSAPMLTQAVACLSDHLPVTDVAQVEFSLSPEVVGRIHDYHAQSRPVLAPGEKAPLEGRLANTGSGVREKVTAGAGSRVVPTVRPGVPPIADPGSPGGAADQCFLLVPNSEAGKRFGEEAQQALPGVHLVSVPGQADLMFCRDQGGLQLEDLEKVLASCRAAYRELAIVPQSSPHARFDIQDWVPLDP
jgi:serine/threonine protein kinase